MLIKNSDKKKRLQIYKCASDFVKYKLRNEFECAIYAADLLFNYAGTRRPRLHRVV